MGLGDAVRYSQVVLDIDGTLRQGDAALPFAVETVKALRGMAKLLLLSNNGSQSPPSVAAGLRDLGFEVDDRDVVNAFFLVKEQLRVLGGPFSLFVIGSKALTSHLEDDGHCLAPPDRAEFVIIGVEPFFTFAQLAEGLHALQGGAQLVAVSLDSVYPHEHGLRPGAGALVGAFRGLGFQPTYVCGKPDPWAIQHALSLREMQAGPHCLFVGDHLEVDVAGAQRVGADSALVLTGVSPLSAVGAGGVKPTYVIRTLEELPAIVSGEDRSEHGSPERLDRPTGRVRHHCGERNDNGPT